MCFGKTPNLTTNYEFELRTVTRNVLTNYLQKVSLKIPSFIPKFLAHRMPSVRNVHRKWNWVTAMSLILTGVKAVTADGECEASLLSRPEFEPVVSYDRASHNTHIHVSKCRS
jgi:hypothetical protein